MLSTENQMSVAELVDSIDDACFLIELRRALDGAWYPFRAQGEGLSYETFYGDAAQQVWKERESKEYQAFIIPHGKAIKLDQSEQTKTPYEWLQDETASASNDAVTASTVASVACNTEDAYTVVDATSCPDNMFIPLQALIHPCLHALQAVSIQPLAAGCLVAQKKLEDLCAAIERAAARQVISEQVLVGVLSDAVGFLAEAENIVAQVDQSLGASVYRDGSHLSGQRRIRFKDAPRELIENGHVPPKVLQHDAVSSLEVAQTPDGFELALHCSDVGVALPLNDVGEALPRSGELPPGDVGETVPCSNVGEALHDAQEYYF